MSQLTRLASTNSQEAAIKKVERAFTSASASVAGFTTIGKAPQTVIIDVTYQGSDIYIDRNGEITIHDKIFDPADVRGMAAEITRLKLKRQQERQQECQPA